MTTFRLTLLDELHQALVAAVLRDKSEYVAMVVCGRSTYRDPWTGVVEERFLARKVVSVDDTFVVSRSPSHIEWSSTPFYRLLKEVEAKDLAIAVVHSHPSGPLVFSKADDVAEKELFGIGFNRLESRRPHLSIILDGGGAMIARAYGDDLQAHPVASITTIGRRWAFDATEQSPTAIPDELERQVRAFGRESTASIRRLTVGLVGCGGTGSAIAGLLARIGVRRLVLFDPDRVDTTNLNRMHFSTRRDAILGRTKVEVVAEGVANVGLVEAVLPLPFPVYDERCWDAVRACDVVFGCTDDHLGRNFLNRLSRFYLIPVIDMGVLVDLADTGGYAVFDGRVTVVQPGSPCQLCRGLINPAKMHEEGLRRHDRDQWLRYRQAGYIVGSDEPSPAVVTFTTEVATRAVNEMFQRLNAYRGDDGACDEHVRRYTEVKDGDTVPGGRSQKGCKVCDSRQYDGRGDMTPFLDQA